jgi:hypothetical protein
MSVVFVSNELPEIGCVSERLFSTKISTPKSKFFFSSHPPFSTILLHFINYKRCVRVREVQKMSASKRGTKERKTRNKERIFEIFCGQVPERLALHKK